VEPVALTPLSEAERDDLHRLEGIVRRGIETFLEVGRALKEIHDRKLYRASHRSFHAYVSGHFGMERAHAHRLVQSAAVVANLSPMGDIPMPVNERQIRPLTRFEKPEKQREVWAEVLKTNPLDTPITAKHVERVAFRLRPRRRRSGTPQVNALVERVDRPVMTNRELANAKPCIGMKFADLAIMDLEKIAIDDVDRHEAFVRVVTWIAEHSDEQTRERIAQACFLEKAAAGGRA
jgi:hypothetical protein